MTTDLLSPPVPPTAQVHTGVTLPLGSTASNLRLTGDAAAAFHIEGATSTPAADGSGVWYEIAATNTSDREVRLTALVDYA